MKVLLKIYLCLLLVSCTNQSKENASKNTSFSKEISNKDVSNRHFSKNEVLDKIILKNVNLKCRGNGTVAANVYGSGVTFYFTIINDSDVGIKKIFFKGTFQFAGRSYVHTEDINYEFRKGLEPGETQKVAIRPGVLSKWNDKIKPGDKGDFNLKIQKVEMY